MRYTSSVNNTIMKRIGFLVFITLLLTQIAGLANDFRFKHYTNKQGLSHNTIYCSLQDKRGFLWFGTDEGLNRFDGHTFKVYRHNSLLEASLPCDKIINLFEDSQGKLWICCETTTCYYDYEKDKFIPLQLNIDNRLFNYSFAIKEDSRQNLWFLHYDGVIKHSPGTKESVFYPREKYFRPMDITFSEKGEALFADPHNLFLHQYDTDQFTSYTIISASEKESQAEISCICSLPGNEVLIGSNKVGVKLFNQTSGKLEIIIPDIHVRMIYPSNENEYWIASESGIFIYNRITRLVINLRKSLTNEYAIADNAVYSLLKDKEGGIWVGSFFGGISYLPKEYTRFKNYVGGKTHPGMLGNAVREICPDQYGNLWLGTEDNGINKYNLQTGEMTNFSGNNAQHPLSATNIHGLLAYKNELWIGTFNKGIDILDISSGKIIRRYTRENTNNTLHNDFILCFYPTKEGDMLIGTASGVVIYDHKKETFSSWQNIYSSTRQIYEDQSGLIWVVTTDGLYRYSPENKEVIRYTNNPNNTASLNSNNTTSVFEDSAKRIWITTVNGFCLFDKHTNTFSRITTENGLPSNIVYRILEDKAKNFWISTANGLVRFNPETSAIRIFTHTDGLHETQFNFSSSYKSLQGTMYMGTINGLVSFTPEEFQNDAFSPPIYITDIRLPQKENEKRMPVINNPVETINNIRLPYNLSTFSIAYTALSFTSPEAIQYAYMLEGSDRNWIQMNHNREVTFANLSPGKYKFKVKSTNSSGIWQENEKVLNIVITPPFWATGWAYTIYLLLTGILVYLLYAYKKAKLEEKHRISREIFESKKEKELYNAKIQFFTFITHEIRTPLTLIKAPLEKILKSGDGNASTRENLNLIEKNTGRLLELSNQLLDFRKAESKGFKLNFVKTDINRLLETIVQLFQSTLSAKNKVFTLLLPDQHLIGYTDREAFAKIIGNLLTNAIKYSDCNIILQAEIAVKDDSSFSISVINDGKLIPENEKEKIFEPFYRLKDTENITGSGIGLSLARSLAEFHNGTLSYYHTIDKQNQFTLVIPKEQDISFTNIEDESIFNSVQAESVSVPQRNKVTVLIAEDQPDMRRFIACELAELYQVLEAGNGKEALDILKTQPVNIIVSDVMMPVMDGFDFCNKVKNNINYSHIPFIILTAQHNLQSRLEGLNNGADAYIEKPFSMDLLLAQICNLLKSRELLNKAYLEKPLTSNLTLAASKLDDLFLEKFNTFLENNLSNSLLTVEMLAEEMNMSTSSLYRKVKGISGLSPVDFIKIARLKKAILLMQEGETRMNEISFMVGFSSPAYFSTCFLKQYGTTPSDFIKKAE